MLEQLNRLIRFWNSPYGPICIASFVLAILDTFFFDITLVTFLLLLLAASPWLLRLLEEMELPGGFKVKTKDLMEYTEKAKDAGLFKNPDTSNADNATYRKIYGEDSNLALAGLRIELEKRLVRIAEIAGITQGTIGVGRLIRTLRDENYLTQAEYALLADLIPTLNQAVHGKKVTKEAADWVINDGSKILAGLDEKIATLEKNDGKL